MLQPKRVKFRKVHRGRRSGAASTGNRVTHGDYGLKALAACWLTDRQIEAGRISITRYLKRGGKVWVRVFPDKSVTKKPAEVRMGGGKANVSHWVAVVRPGKVLYEVSGAGKAEIAEALRLASHKLPIPTKVVGYDRLESLAGVE